MFGVFKGRDFETALLRALDQRDVTALGRAIRKHGPDAVDRDGRTALINAASRNDLVAAGIALDAGCAVDAADKQGLTSLHFAVIASSLPMADLLLRAGAAVDPRDSWGNIPLNRAVPLPHQSDAEALVSRLIAAGADPDVANHSGVHPASWAGSDPRLATLLQRST